MKKKLFMALGIALALLACLGLFSFITGIGDVTAAIKEAAAENTSTTRIYLGAVTDALTVLVMIVAAVVCFAVAFEDGGVGYEVSEDEEEEGEPQEEYDEDDEEEDPDEQVARLEEQKRAEEEKANFRRGANAEKFVGDLLNRIDPREQEKGRKRGKDPSALAHSDGDRQLYRR